VAETRLCGYGPTTKFVLLNDVALTKDKTTVESHFRTNIEALLLYTERLFPCKEDYAANLKFNPVRIIEEKGILQKIHIPPIFLSHSFSLAPFIYVK
jgi:hypothetical protein